MSIAHECKCGLVTPVPDAQGGKRLRCKGCGLISLVVCPELLDPDPVPVPAGEEDTAPPPPPRKPFKYRRQLSREEEREDYPRTGGVIDWRKVHDGDENDYHHDPVPPDPQTRYLNPPQAQVPYRVLKVASGLTLIAFSILWTLIAVVYYDSLPCLSVGVFAFGCGLVVRGFFGRAG